MSLLCALIQKQKSAKSLLAFEVCELGAGVLETLHSQQLMQLATDRLGRTIFRVVCDWLKDIPFLRSEGSIQNTIRPTITIFYTRGFIYRR